MYSVIKDCRLCRGPLSDVLIKFPDTSLANEFVSAQDTNEPQDTFTLEVLVCLRCACVQLSGTVDPERLFRNYVYVSGTSKTFVEHFKQYAGDVLNKTRNQGRRKNKPKQICDIGSNDGTLLKQFKSLGCRVLGIDPAVELARKATAVGIETLPEFFNETIARKIVKERGLPDIVTANNVFAHTDKLIEFTKAIKILIGDVGVFVFEVSYLPDVIQNGYFDCIYHEHIFYDHLHPLFSFFNKHDMTLFDVERVDTHGGSIRCYVRNGHCDVERSVYKLLDTEAKAGYCDPRQLSDILTEFSNKINVAKADLMKLIHSIRAEGKSIVGFGAPAKFTTLATTFGITSDILDFIVEDSPLKINLFTPGSHIPVVSKDRLNEADYCIIFAWNFAESIIRNNPQYSGKWIVPLPELKTI